MALFITRSAYAALPRSSNMVFIDCVVELQQPLTAYLQQRGILIGGYGQLRLVTHLDIADADIGTVVEVFTEFLDHHGAG